MDPFVLLLGCRGGDAVHHVVPFHYSPISLGFTRLNQLTTIVGDVQLKAVLLEDEQKCSGKLMTIDLPCDTGMQTYWFSWIFNLTDTKVFQWNDTSRLLILSGKQSNVITFLSPCCKI